MTTNNPVPKAGPGQIPPGAFPPVPIKKIPREFSKAERGLVFVSLFAGILCDRLLLANLFGMHAPFFSAVFWFGVSILYYVFFWSRLKKNKILWMVAGFTAALCLWNIIFDYNSEYGYLTMLVIPAVLMAHLQFFAGGYRLKEVGRIAAAWLAGCFVRPFSAIAMMLGASASMVSGARKSVFKRAVLGILLACGMLLIILPILASADRVFGYYIRLIFSEFRIAQFLWHLTLSLVFASLLYSLLWNAGYAQQKEKPQIGAVAIDPLISAIVLGSIIGVYLLFCTVQFTYLFAGAGLPHGITHSEYAREGFSQIIAVCSINLLVFGVFLRYAAPHKATTILLSGLLGVTFIMLISGFVRLRLYIHAYGLTWLRLLSGWFILYLAAVLVLCGVRMVRERLPLIAVCALVLLGWYTALGYANPDALTLQYNLKTNHDSIQWVRENERYISGLSDNGVLVLKRAQIEGLEEYLSQRAESANGYSISSARLRRGK